VHGISDKLKTAPLQKAPTSQNTKIFFDVNLSGSILSKSQPVYLK